MAHNCIYDVTVLEKNIQERLIKNYSIEAERAKYGHVAGDCFWTKQTLADITMEALPFAKYFNPEVFESLYSIYLKMSVE